MANGAFPPVARRRVVVTGIGAVTPLGSTMTSTWSNLLSGRSSGRPLEEVPFYFPLSSKAAKATGSGAAVTAHHQRIRDAIPCGVACPVVDDAGDPYDAKSRFAPTAREPRSHRFCHAAAEEALRDAGLLVPPSPSETKRWTYGGTAGNTATSIVPPRERVGVNIGMGIPSLTDVAETADHLQLFYRPTATDGGDAVCHYNRVHPFFVPKILGNMGAGSIALSYGFRGPIGSNVAACATGAHCIGEAARWIQDGVADVAVAGGTEACINPISIAGFSRMRALATTYNDRPANASRPFDQHRAGFVMGEGAGLLVLESLGSASARGARIYAELRGFGCSSDAYHVSSPDPEGFGARSCVAAALRNAYGVRAQDVAYVNAHATSTPMGDEIELKALTDLFGGRGGSAPAPLLVSSSKGALGHLLGAAGSVEAAITVLAVHHKVAPPNVNLVDAIPHDAANVRLNVEPVAMADNGSARLAAISTSFGFGGVNTALVFCSYVP